MTSELKINATPHAVGKTNNTHATVSSQQQPDDLSNESSDDPNRFISESRASFSNPGFVYSKMHVPYKNGSVVQLGIDNIPRFSTTSAMNDAPSIHLDQLRGSHEANHPHSG